MALRFGRLFAIIVGLKGESECSCEFAHLLRIVQLELHLRMRFDRQKDGRRRTSAARSSERHSRQDEQRRFGGSVARELDERQRLPLDVEKGEIAREKLANVRHDNLRSVGQSAWHAQHAWHNVDCVNLTKEFLGFGQVARIYRERGIIILVEYTNLAEHFEHVQNRRMILRQVLAHLNDRP